VPISQVNATPSAKPIAMVAFSPVAGFPLPAHHGRQEVGGAGQAGWHPLGHHVTVDHGGLDDGIRVPVEFVANKPWSVSMTPENTHAVPWFRPWFGQYREDRRSADVKA
jgi:hypothetical protein